MRVCLITIYKTNISGRESNEISCKEAANHDGPDYADIKHTFSIK